MQWARLAVLIAYAVLCGALAAADAAAAATGTPLDVVQIIHGYGLAGLAGLLIYAQWRSHERMAAALDRHEALLVELVRENARIAERCAQMSDDLCHRMDQRPCLRSQDDGK